MSVEKRVKYDVQGGVKNYLGKQKEVKAPLKWQSSPDHPTTELAYITQAEKDLLVKQDLHGSLKGGVNRGPSGIMSLNGWGSADESQNRSGGDISSAESGGDRHGMSDRDASDFRSAAINAGAGQRVNAGFFDSSHVVSPAELAAAKTYRNQNTYAGNLAKGAWNQTRGSGLGSFISGGGITGALIKGIGQKLGFGKQWNEPTYNMDPNRFADEFQDEYGYGADYQGEKPMGFLTGDDDNSGEGGANNTSAYILPNQQTAKAPESPTELLDFIQRFRVKEPYSQIKGSDYVQEASDIAERMKNFYTV
jgi:hypothetical protein